jgi:hypothetical protein
MTSFVYDRCTINPAIVLFGNFWAFAKSITCVPVIGAPSPNPTLTARFPAPGTSGLLRNGA